MYLRKPLTFRWCQMIDGSQLTRCCRITVVMGRPSDDDFASTLKLLQFRLLSINGASVMLPIPLSFLRRCPAVQLPTLLWLPFEFRLQSNSDWLCGGVKSLIYHTLVITDFRQFKIYRSLPSCWVVGLWLNKLYTGGIQLQYFRAKFFYTLTDTRSECVDWGKMHTGLYICNAETTAEHLLKWLVIYRIECGTEIEHY